MMAAKRGAERAAGVTGRRLDPDAVEGLVAQQLAVGDAVERHAAGEAEVRVRRFRAQASASSRSTISSVTAWTDGGEIHVALRQWLTPDVRGGPPNRSSNLRVRHREAGAVVEIVHVRAGTSRRP